MDAFSRRHWCSILLCFFVFFIFIPDQSSFASSDELEVVSHPAKLRLPPRVPVESSPGAKPGSLMVCNRVYIRGLSRFRNLDKYAHSLKVSVGLAQEDPGLRVPAFEVCFHSNASIGVGMCPPGAWQRVVKGHWVQSMSPYGIKILDTRMPHSASSKVIEVSTEEEFLFHRMVFLIIGMVMMVLAHGLSDSVVFYYGSAMTVGILLVVMIVLFQGMKLLPTGRRSSFAIFMYSSVVGLITFVLSYLSGLLRSILVEIGVTEDMHNPLAIFLGVCFIMAGAWLGFWSVRKFVLDEDGIIDTGVAYFVEWTILIFAAAMILESSLDMLLAAEALVLGITMSALSRTKRKLRLLRRLYRRILRCFRHCFTYIRNQCGELKTGSDSFDLPIKPFKLASCTSYMKGQLSGSVIKTPQKPAMEDTYYSSFHSTPERKRFSKEEWKTFTKESTKQALEELVSSPDFGHWAAANAERITVTPSKDNDTSEVHRRVFGLRW